MRYIPKNEPPQALINWKANRHAAGQSLDFQELGRVQVNGDDVDVKKAIKKQRLADQGHLCAYTLMRIDLDTSHVEHLKPQTFSRINDRIQHFIEETVDYGNMVLCYPKREDKGGIGYGAPHRGEKPLAVTPREDRCEKLIQYKLNGRVFSEDPDVKKMVDEVLKLNHDTLIDRRRGAYHRKGLGLRSAKPLSEREAARLSEAVLQKDAKNRLAPFCIGISHAAQEHINLIRKRRNKKAMARKR